MTQNSFVIGLTGGSGSGKSIAARAAVDLGFVHIDTDRACHALLLKSGGAYRQVVQAFGTGILDDEGEIVRKRLGAIVFSDAQKLRLLNSIVHPLLTEQIRASLTGDVLIDGAVLHQTPVFGLCDKIIAVCNSRERRIEMICKRDGLTPAAAQKRIDSQPDNAAYERLADIVLYNTGSADALYKKAKIAILEAKA